MDFDKPPAKPLPVFNEWLAAAEEKEINDPNAVAVATVDADGLPNLRMVLLKGHDERGFVFYTNFDSTKGRELLAHPKRLYAFIGNHCSVKFVLEAQLNKCLMLKLMLILPHARAAAELVLGHRNNRAQWRTVLPLSSLSKT